MGYPYSSYPLFGFMHAGFINRNVYRENSEIIISPGAFIGGVISMTPKVVERSAIEAYELRTGFIGLGEYYESHGWITIVDRVIGCENSSK